MSKKSGGGSVVADRGNDALEVTSDNGAMWKRG